ncbi:MFS transporter [Agromyces seonyuensis]|uniref:MFS transporter n=1 Tax=Agromyces seonyuensis TaxID=2662446 RepID=A0A6I4P4Y9_9MICO|nr:MFS transporter [Agromyces seonyuensis]MWB99439.1 MFS transporter [Agromyces seonyuensis]
MNENDDNISALGGAAAPLAGPVAAEEAVALAAAAHVGEQPDLPQVRPAFIWLLFGGVFGVYLAFVTPLALSLSIRVAALAPGHAEYLGYVLGVGSLAALLVGPLGGQLSDRTRSRLGRRRPWLIGGMIGGTVALVVLAAAPNLLTLAIGWVLAQITFSQVINNFVTIQADRLPESQRGKVAGITGLATMVAPVFGSAIAGSLASSPYALFLVPGAVALVLVGLFVARYREADSRGLVFETPLTAKSVLSKYLFNPMENRDFGWNWLGRFLFFFGLTLATTFTAFFYSARLGLSVEEVGGLIAIAGLIGVAGTILGAIGGGFLSDRFKRRKPFILVAAVGFLLGTVLQAIAPDLTLLIFGSVLGNFAIGVFSAVDQALMIDVLPERDTDAGRYISITQFAVTIPQAAAPVAASLILAIGVGAGEQNYPLLYVVAGILTLLGGLVILRIKSVR